MKPSEIFDIMDLARRARENNKIFNIMLVSPPGLGKTEIIEQWCQKVGYQYLPFSLATSDAPDFKGFPNIQVIDGRQRMSFALPDHWPLEGKGVIVLEELNRTTQATMQCVLSLGDKRRGFDGYKLPEGWLIVGCVNEGSIYETNEMDPALKDRFEMFHVSYDKKSHIKFMQETNYHQDIINFVDAGLWTYRDPEAVGNVPGAKYIAPRTLSKLDAAISSHLTPEHELMVYETILGTNVAKDFYNFRHNESPVMMSDLLKGKKSALKKLTRFSDPNNYKNGMISLTVKDVIQENTIEDDLLADLIEVLPVEQGKALIFELELKRKMTEGELLLRVAKKNSKIKELFKSVVNLGK